jgi:hypothetical protein
MITQGFCHATGVPDLTLLFDRELATYPSSAAWQAVMDEEAQRLAQALYRTLPAGVLDRLAAHLLLLVASQLRPTYPQLNKELPNVVTNPHPAA